ncbi:aminopeptidase P N-terminal domain-containing protein [Bordetella sp. BOR01]|uniref:aminopeptidase P N-terminal domain-containing protein n=1 Tax=Bordetella sp. BOR01 TaxID=2854779 RepID=UPI001C46A50B|nr:aminopeptidase P N-terminal domain-containing protein [Bordetella sp. BOR01]MBV7481642.1 aminopeptidase P N-terminal domain-containing protein [Bordetella sp. BOR01]
MSLPATDIAPYADRRRRLLAHLRAAGGGIAVLATAPHAMRNRDTEYPYRHDSDFYYLTGFTEPDAWLVLVAGAFDRAILFCRARHPEQETWEGYRCGPELAAQRYGFDAAHAIDELDELMPALLLDQPALYRSFAAAGPVERKLRRWQAEAEQQGRGRRQPPAHIHDLRPVLADMRLVKDASEIAAMRQAARISAGAHARAMRATRAGLHEYELEAELLYEFRRHGAQAPAYPSIVAAGANACVLHYAAGDTVLRDGELVLIDAGCEVDSYASDVTRTFPVNGHFSGPQRALYDLTKAAQEAAVAATAPGRAWNDAHEAAVRVLAQGMLDEGLLQGSLDGVIESGTYTRFYMHRTGHWLGLDVHDAGDYRAGPASGEERPWRTLEPGMVLTIEPGIYVRAADDVPRQFWDIGIRIEDDALVTEEGCELITRGVPVDAREIEALMRE